MIGFLTNRSDEDGMRCNFAPKQEYQRLKPGLGKEVHSDSQCGDP